MFHHVNKIQGRWRAKSPLNPLYRRQWNTDRQVQARQESRPNNFFASQFIQVLAIEAAVPAHWRNATLSVSRCHTRLSSQAARTAVGKVRRLERKNCPWRPDHFPSQPPDLSPVPTADLLLLQPRLGGRATLPTPLGYGPVWSKVMMHFT
jgi:hypothetical protein